MQDEDSPKDQWCQLEFEVLTDTEKQEHIFEAAPGDDTPRRLINKRLVTCLERATRALCRWFTLGGGAPEARQYQGVIAEFCGLMDADLGSRHWPLNSATSTTPT